MYFSKEKHKLINRSSAYDFGLRANLQKGYLKNSDLNARLSQLENHQPEVAEFIAGGSLTSMAIHSLKVTHNVSFSSFFSFSLFPSLILNVLNLFNVALDGITRRE